MTPADKGTFHLSAAAFLVDCEKQPGSFGHYISFPCGKPEGALSGFNIGAIYTVLVCGLPVTVLLPVGAFRE